MKLFSDKLALIAMMVCLALATAGCESDPDEMDEDDVEDQRVEQGRNGWPAHTGSAGKTIDLSAYTTLTLVPFTDLTDDAIEDGAGEEFVEELRDQLEDRYDGVFTTITIGQPEPGQAGNLVVRGQVFDFSSGGYAPFVGRITPRFEADFVLEDGATGEVLKSSEIKEKGEPNNMAMLREAAGDVARLLGRSKK